MRTARAFLAACSAGLFLASACKTDIVYRDRQPFNPAPDLASGLLGYYTFTSRQTTCGNCHAGHQADWAETHHANAFADLVGSGHASASCYGCHTVSERGNGLAAAAGWSVKADSAYKDVQCESCHGPGAEHVKLTEDRTKWPLARLTLTIASNGCAACHTGVHTPFAEEWATSGHANIVTAAVNNSNAECKNCHDGKTVLRAWGVVTNYEERDSTGYSAATCAVCHNPHGSPNTHQLRFPIDTPDPDQNLCMKCHLRRGEPTPGSSTPHGVQGFVVLGTGGYRPAGTAIDTQIVLTTHASVANPRLCAGCHVNAYDVTDPNTGSFVFHSTGHLFRPIPCLDADGKPTAANTCAYTPTPVRSFTTCARSGCHGSEAVAAGLLATVKSDIASMADVLWLDRNGNKVIDAPPADTGYLALIKRDHPTDLSTTASVTPAKGAAFNVETFGEDRYGHGDKSHGVHNPFLARVLLQANITELRTVYGFPAPPAAVAEVMRRAVEDVRKRQPDFLRDRRAMK